MVAVADWLEISHHITSYQGPGMLMSNYHYPSFPHCPSPSPNGNNLEPQRGSGKGAGSKAKGGQEFKKQTSTSLLLYMCLVLIVSFCLADYAHASMGKFAQLEDYRYIPFYTDLLLTNIIRILLRPTINLFIK